MSQPGLTLDVNDARGVTGATYVETELEERNIHSDTEEGTVRARMVTSGRHLVISLHVSSLRLFSATLRT